MTITDALQRTTLPLEPLAVAVDELHTAVEPLGQRTLAAVAQVLEPLVPPDMRFRQRPSLNFEAHLARVAGWEAQSRYDLEGALDHYERAVELDPTDLRTRLRMASVTVALVGDIDARVGTRIDSLLQSVNGARGRLVPADHAWLDFLLASRGRDRSRAYEAAKRWAALSPGATVASWNWALEAIRFNRPHEAVRVLNDIDPAKFAQGHFTATDYWTTLMDALHLVGDHRREVRTARRALALRPDDPVLLQWGAVAFAAGGLLTDVQASIDARLALPPDGPFQTLGMLALIGREMEVHGRGEAGRNLSRATFERLVASYVGRAAREPGSYESLMWYGIGLAHLGRLAEADATFRMAAAAAPEDSVPGLAIWANAWLGDVAAQRGDFDEVARIDEWLAVDRRPWGWGSFFRACIAARLERKAQAVDLMRRAFSEGMHRNPPAPRWHRYPCFDTLRDYGSFQELIRPRG
jgi:tetratricopeptide (TPR) repeat protein